MSFLSRLFGSAGSSSDAPKDAETELQRLEADAENAEPAYVGTAFNKAGDLALRSDQPDRAVGYYGRAIDAFLEDAQREAARGVANKIIRVRPSAVRTLCTLAWLDIAAGHQATALLHLRDYVASAKQASQNSRAATQIYAMARLSPDREFVEAVADALDGLDFSRRAEEVRGWSGNGSPDALEDPDELADACLVAAVRSNDRDAQLLRDSDGDDDTEADDTKADDTEADDTEADDTEADDTEADDTPKDDGDSDGPGNSKKNKKKYRWD